VVFDCGNEGTVNSIAYYYDLVAFSTVENIRVIGVTKK